MRLEVAKVSGAATGEVWSYAHVFSPEKDIDRKNKGELVVIVTLKGVVGGGVLVVEMGRDILALINESYYSGSGGILDELKRVTGRTRELVEAKGAGGMELELVMGVFLEGEEVETVYLIADGGGKVWVGRGNGRMGKVLEAGEVGRRTASGKLSKNDLIIIGSDKLFDLPEGVIRAALMSGEVDNIAEMLAPLVESKEGSAGVIVRVVEEENLVEGKIQIESKKTEDTKGGVFDKITGKFDAVRMKWGQKPVYVGSTRAGGELRGRRKKVLRVIAVVILILLGTSLFLGGRERQRRELEARFGMREREALSKFEEGKSLADINPGKARELLVQAKEIGEGLVQEGYGGEKLANLMNKMGDVLGVVSGEYRVEPELLADLTLVRDDLVGERLAYSMSELKVLDVASKRLVSVNTGTKAVRVVAGGNDLIDSKLVGAYADRGFILNGGGILEVRDVGGKSETKKVIDRGDDWSEIAALVAYGGNIYVLDRGTSVIWRYPGIEGGFGAGQKWLANGEEIDLSKAMDMAIDGSIWVVTTSGKIAKLVMGVPEGFEINGLTGDLGEIYRVDTNEDASNLYLLDRTNGRVVVVDKETGEYKRQFIWEGMRGVGDIAVDEKMGKLYLLTGSKIMMVGLK